MVVFFFFFQAEDGIRDLTVTGVQTCALPISSPIRFLPGSHPDSHRMRVSIQSRPGKRSAISGVQISPVGRRLTNTVLTACPAPIFARTMCSPLGVQKLPCSSPGPLREVETT